MMTRKHVAKRTLIAGTMATLAVASLATADEVEIARRALERMIDADESAGSRPEAVASRVGGKRPGRHVAEKR